MEQQNTEFKRNFDLASFKRASSGMVSKNDEVYGDYDYLSWRSKSRTLKVYKPEEIDNFINEKKYDLKEEVSVKSDYYLNTNHEYEVKCLILENGSHLIDMTLTVPTQTEAEAIVNNWNRKNQEIYALLLSQLL